MEIQKQYFPIDKINSDPFTEFQQWYNLALKHGNLDVEAMSLATSTLTGKPSVRVVLFKGLKDGGFTFYTNYESQKGYELKLNPQAAVAFYWPLIYRQVRIDGTVSRLTRKESEAYFHSRPRESQLAALTSHQSQTIMSLEDLHKKFDTLTKEYAGKEVPCPQYWGGYKLIPTHFEFWLGQDHRLHHRFNYSLEKGLWKQSYLSP